MAHPIDILVGKRITRARIAIHMSQTTLGSLLAGGKGVTFQQVQKYEKGANRVSMSRMVEIAEALGKPLAYFVDDLGDGLNVAANDPIADKLFADRRGLRLATAFVQIEDIEMKDAILRMAEIAASKAARQNGAELEPFQEEHRS
jgi:transcriptional regulator with XRE-family HTH domain